MEPNPEKKKRKRPSKGMRTHNRRLKQENRKANLPDAGLKKSTRAA
jgi:hypothetical protein